MSTTFGIPPRKVSISNLVDEENELHDYINTDWFTPIFFRSMNNSRWLTTLAWALPDDTIVYALDNTRQGIYTIKDCKELLKKEQNEGTVY
jgi:hypothetical protein